MHSHLSLLFINKGLSDGLTTLSREINDNMAAYAISKVEKQAGSIEGKNILILGLSYRGNVKEPTKSTALLLISQMRDKGAQPFVNDPLFSDREIRQYGATPLSLDDTRCSEMDAIILQAFHQEYSMIDFSQFPRCQLILDGRNKFNKNEISQPGIAYEGIGNEGGL